MQILWKKHPSKPELNGTKEHVSRQFAEVAIGYGQAEACPRPRYGTAAWLAERKAMSAAANPAAATEWNKISGNSAPDVSVPFTAGVVWSIHPDVRSGRTYVVKESGREKSYFEWPPDEAPDVIKKQFKEMSVEGAFKDRETIEVAQRAQANHNISIQNARRW
jgi:hypothetical protein